MLIHSHYRPGSESANMRVFIHVFIYKPIDSDRVAFGVSISGVEKRRLKNKQKKKQPKPVVKEAEQQPRPAPKELNSPPKPAPKQADQLHSCSPDVSTCSGDIRVAASDDVTELQRLLEKKKQELQLKLSGVTAPVQSEGLFSSLLTACTHNLCSCYALFLVGLHTRHRSSIYFPCLYAVEGIGHGLVVKVLDSFTPVCLSLLSYKAAPTSLARYL